jgi:hypothetical protein
MKNYFLVLIFFVLVSSCKPILTDESKKLILNYRSKYTCYSYDIGTYKMSSVSDTITYNFIALTFYNPSNYDEIDTNITEINELTVLAQKVYLDVPERSNYNGIRVEFRLNEESSYFKTFIYTYDSTKQKLNLINQEVAVPVNGYRFKHDKTE